MEKMTIEEERELQEHLEKYISNFNGQQIGSRSVSRILVEGFNKQTEILLKRSPDPELGKVTYTQ